ncbi:hypothetical protein [Candidatus Nitrospira salsa]
MMIYPVWRITTNYTPIRILIIYSEYRIHIGKKRSCPKPHTDLADRGSGCIDKEAHSQKAGGNNGQGTTGIEIQPDIDSARVLSGE